MMLNSLAATHYVSPLSRNPLPPFTTWDTAAHTIQDAVDAAADHDEVVVTNGVYDTGGATVVEPLMNRVAVTKPILLRSVNGPESAVIMGSVGSPPVRCIRTADGALLNGFTLTNGSSLISTNPETSGGGAVWCASTNVVISNCVLAGSQAYVGSGVYGGTLFNCAITNNSGFYTSSTSAPQGGGACRSILDHCLISGSQAALGGGVFQCTLYHCTVANNEAIGDDFVQVGGGGAFDSFLYDSTIIENYVFSISPVGGGADHCVLSNCVLNGNSASSYGGGAVNCMLDACTIVSNRSNYGGGTASSSLFNCLVQGNTAESDGGGVSTGTITNCVFKGNSARNSGGAASNSTLFNCTLIGNGTAGTGGGAASSTLYNCTIISNTAMPAVWEGSFPAGGAAACTLMNCIVMFNRSVLPANANYDSTSAFSFSCADPLPAGIGNIDADPLFTDPGQGDFRLVPGSPCIDTGANLASLPKLDLGGLTRVLDGNASGVAQVDMGAYEFNPYRFLGVQGPPPNLSHTLVGEPNHTVRIEASSDFLNWTPLQTLLLPASGQTQLQAQEIKAKSQFIRAVRVE